MVLVLQKDEWVVSAGLMQHLSDLFSTFGGTQIIEDGFKRERDLERHNTNKLTSCASKWAKLVDSNLIDDVHNMKNIDWEAEAPPLDCTKSMAECAFAPSQKRAPAIYKSVMGKSTVADWYSPAPLYSIQPDVDHAVISEIAGRYRHQWSIAWQSWWRVLLNTGDQCLLLRHAKKHTTKDWFFCLGLVGAGAGSWNYIS